MSIMNIAYKYRIYPTPEQEELFQKTFGCCRKIWNLMLNDKNESYKNTGVASKSTPAQYKDEYPFLREVDSLALANVQLDLNEAFKSFFDEKVKHPKFKSKKKAKKSYTTNWVNDNIKTGENFITLPKLGDVKAKFHRQLPEWVTPKEYKAMDDDSKKGLYALKSVTISQTKTGKYYASILFENTVDELPPHTRDFSHELGGDKTLHRQPKDQII